MEKFQQKTNLNRQLGVKQLVVDSKSVQYSVSSVYNIQGVHGLQKKNREKNSSWVGFLEHTK